jgi:hypothetical protein
MRCCDCKFRKECPNKQNNLTAFESCSLGDSFSKRYEVVNNTFGGVNQPPAITLCEKMGMLGQCGLECPAFDGRICGVV